MPDSALTFWKRDQLMWIERAVFPDGTCMTVHDLMSERWTPQPLEDFADWTARMAGFEYATDQELNAELEQVIAAFSGDTTIEDLTNGSVAHWRRFAFEPFHMLSEAEKFLFERLLQPHSATNNSAY